MKRILIFLLLISFTAPGWSQKRTTKKAKKQTTQKKSTPAKKKTTAAPVKKKEAEPAVAENEPDTMKQKTVVITSSFKPSLRNAAKVNFSAASPLPDSVLPTLQYNVPSQNLVFAYEPTTLKPVALSIDSLVPWENSNYIKAGFGNYSTPFLQAGFSFGDGKQTIINANVNHISSKGKLPFQEYSKTGAEVIGIFNPNDNIEVNGKVYFDNNSQYQYGFLPDTLKYNKDDIRQRFTTFGIKAGLRNKQENSFGISYAPSINFSAFNDNRNGKETNLVVDAPLSKSFMKIFAFNLGVTADITSYKSDSAKGGTINNNLFYVSPAVQYKTPNLKIVAGFTPAWDNSSFNMLPNFTLESKIKDEKFIFMAGWKGYYNKTTYQYLAGINPWLQHPTDLLNTKMNEFYAGFKGSAGSHFTYNAKVSYLKYNNQPLFVNDTITGKSFQIVNEPDMKAIRLHGEIGYTEQEKFSLLAGATLTQFSDLQVNEKAWGMLPLEVNGSLRWQLLKDLMIKGDVFFWDGAQYRNKVLQSQKLSAAMDMNAGVEFTVLPQLNVWVQFNNLFNNRYQRWNQYEVLGFNVLGGVVYSFGKSGK
ncbi:MAG: hypothetical protein J0I41_11260 [Filimonas sp.]|nr:hypothetical protein [Filimonas sp.]